MPTSAATGTMHLHTTTANPEAPSAQEDASQAQAQEEAVEAQAPTHVLRGHTMPTAAEKSWNDKADTGHGRVSRSKRAAGYEERRQVAPERQEGSGYEVVTEPEPVKPKAKAAKKTARGRDD